MNSFDGSGVLELDGRSLQVYLAVLETGSVTAAAAQLGVTQSAVSHTLEKLRGLLHDPLFVKSGRGVVATAHAQALGEPARRLLDDMQALARGSRFDPATAAIHLAIAANDFQRDLLLPSFHARVSARVKRLSIEIIPSEAPSAEMLRERHADLVITPRPPEGTDILQKRLLVDKVACFYDARARERPRSLKDYLAARHVAVVYEGGRKTLFDQEIEWVAGLREMSVTVPNFSGVAAFLEGSTMIASLPSLMRTGIMRGFGMSPLPCKISPLPMYMVWHRRDLEDPASRWLRDELEATAHEVMAGVKSGP
ncbi:MAG: LysR family transcriptional regulator [Alphaproteobacteria bacterium]